MPNTKHMLKSPLQINAFLLHLKHMLLTVCIRNTSQNRAGTRPDRMLPCIILQLPPPFFFFVNWSLPFHVGDQFLHHMEMQQKPI